MPGTEQSAENSNTEKNLSLRRTQTHTEMQTEIITVTYKSIVLTVYVRLILLRAIEGGARNLDR